MASKKMVSSYYLLHVERVVLHLGVDPHDDGPDGGVVLLDEELDEHQVDHGEPEDEPPEDGVGPGEGAVGERHDREDEEVDGDAAEAGKHVGLVVVHLRPGTEQMTTWSVSGT